MSKKKMLMALLSAALVVTGAGAALAAGKGKPKNEVSFKNDVVPIIQIRCLECHNPGGEGTQVSGLDMSTYEGLMKGTKFGPIVTPGSAMTSNLNVLVEGRAEIRMPHNRRPLSECEVKLFRDWVNQGARNN